MASKGNILLSKKFYGVNKALEILDEEFNEFGLKSINYKEFFNYYNRYFYSPLDEVFHSYVLAESIKMAYPEGYIHPKETELIGLTRQLVKIIAKIDSIEKFLFFIPNRSIVMPFLSTPIDASLDPGSKIQEGENVYMIQSAKKRKITNYQTYLNIKSRLTKGNPKTNGEFVNQIHQDTLLAIPNGPDINNVSDLNISNFRVNIYPQTIEDYYVNLNNPQVYEEASLTFINDITNREIKPNISKPSINQGSEERVD